MPLLFRVIRKNRWRWGAGEPAWLPPGEVPAAPFGDLSPDANSVLSVWQVNDDGSNLPRIVAAMAAGRQHVDILDCALVEEGAVAGLGIKIEAVADRCSDRQAAELWHRNLVELTSSHLRALAELVRADGRLTRFLPGDVERFLDQGLSSGQLDITKFDEKLREYFGRKS